MYQTSWQKYKWKFASII